MNNRISTSIWIQVEDTIEFGVRNQQKEGGETQEQEVRHRSKGEKLGDGSLIRYPSPGWSPRI